MKKFIKYLPYFIILVMAILFFSYTRYKSNEIIALNTKVDDMSTKIIELQKENDILNNSYDDLNIDYENLCDEYNGLESDIEILQKQLIQSNIEPLIPIIEYPELTDGSN